MGILDNLERYLDLDISTIDMQEDIDKELDKE
jgi:hypothetical protein